MRKFILKAFRLLALFIFMLGVTGFDKEASATTLTETLRQFFNHDIQDYTHSFKLKLDDFTVMPFRYITVKGNAAKFRALTWMNDGATGGVKNMSFDGDSDKGDHLFFEGHVIPGDNDMGAEFKLTKGNGGYISMDYGNFRRFYDVYGGYFSNFTSSKAISQLAADPKMDVGHFNFAIGTAEDDARGISLAYERFSRDGIKNMLDWGTAQEGVKQRKIVPSWEEVGQVTDTVTLKARTELAGFKVSGEQRAEFFSSRTFREDNSSLATSASYAQQAQEAQSKQLVSSLKADRWTIDDKTYMAAAYQFQHLRTDPYETIRNLNGSGGISNNSRNVVVNGQATHDAHKWVQHFVTNLTPDLNFVARLKEEVASKNTYSFAQGYSGGSSSAMETESSIMSTGQAVSLRYSGIPKTSLYTDWDFGQTRNWLNKYRVTGTYYENLDKNPEMTGVVGARYVPNNKFNVTSQLKRQSKEHVYDTFANNDPGITIAKLRMNTDEWDSRMTWKLSKWFQNSFRLQLVDNIFRTQSLNQSGFTAKPEWLKSQGTSRIYTYNAVVQPWDEWMFDVGASLNNLKVSTPASQTVTSNGGIPVFVTDIFTLLFTTSYAPKENFSIYSSAQYSRATGFDSQSFNGLPYGPNNESYDITLGARWSPKKDVTLEPHYGYYSYRSNPDDTYSLDYGNYSAHVYWLDTTFSW